MRSRREFLMLSAATLLSVNLSAYAQDRRQPGRTELCAFVTIVNAKSWKLG
jgi:hypothetical protein